MFDWFNKPFTRHKYPEYDHVPNDMAKIADDMNKVLPFPDLKVTPPKEPAGRTVYSVGLTDNNCVSLHIGYGSINMNTVGVQQLIDQLTLFKSQIEQAEE